MEQETPSTPLQTGSGSDRRARVLLIKSRSNDPNWRQLSHPLGLMYVASYLRSRGGHQVRIVDLRLNDLDEGGLRRLIADWAPDMVGISALTFESDAIAWIARAAKGAGERIAVVLGGPHATAYPEQALATPGVDCAVVGEGERTAAELVDRIAAGRDLAGVKGLFYREGDRVVDNGRGDFIEAIDELPMPAYDLVEIGAYKNYDRFSRSGSGDYMGVFSSRGCPYRCVYCHKIFGKAFRARSAESFFAEIRHLYDTYGIREFEVFDDIFNLDRKRLLRFCDLIDASGMRVTFAFPNGLRGDLLDEEQLRRLRKAGTIYISFAVESGSSRIQKLIRKNIQLDAIRRNIAIAHDLRIHAHGFFMIGFPTETRQEMQATVDFLL